MINPNWKRWIKISVNKHFDAGKGSTFLFLEGEDRSKLKDKTSWVELMVTGPNIEELSKNYFELDVTIDALCNVESNNKLYDIDILTGTYQALFVNTIPVYKYGDQPGDDSTLLGCLEIQGKINTTDWGTDSVDIGTRRVAIEGQYKLKL